MVYIANDKYKGSIVKMEKGKVKEILKKEITSNLNEIYNVLNKSESKDQRIALKASISNILNCSVWQVKPKIKWFRYVYKSIKLYDVVDILDKNYVVYFKGVI
jgi:phage-related tail protein